MYRSCSDCGFCMRSAISSGTRSWSTPSQISTITSPAGLAGWRTCSRLTPSRRRNCRRASARSPLSTLSIHARHSSGLAIGKTVTAKACADLRKRTSLTCGTALGGRRSSALAGSETRCLPGRTGDHRRVTCQSLAGISEVRLWLALTSAILLGVALSAILVDPPPREETCEDPVGAQPRRKRWFRKAGHNYGQCALSRPAFWQQAGQPKLDSQAGPSSAPLPGGSAWRDPRPRWRPRSRTRRLPPVRCAGPSGR
jgi:hypothetical protein